jgi:hypothetical protein
MAGEPTPDFSGEFALNRPACTLQGGAVEVRSAILRIERAEPTVRIRATFNFESNHVDYTLEPSSLRWEGHALLFTYQSDAPEAPMTMTWRYELDDSGRRLTATERMRGGGRDADNVWIFDRRND